GNQSTFSTGTFSSGTFSSGTYTGPARSSGLANGNSGNTGTGTTGTTGHTNKATNYFVPADPSLNTPSISATAQRNAAVGGTNTAPAPQGTTGSAVSAPGVGVGHAANGQPIGSPGSGPGSPEQPIDGSKQQQGTQPTIQA